MCIVINTAPTCSLPSHQPHHAKGSAVLPHPPQTITHKLHWPPVAHSQVQLGEFCFPSLPDVFVLEAHFVTTQAPSKRSFLCSIMQRTTGVLPTTRVGGACLPHSLTHPPSPHLPTHISTHRPSTLWQCACCGCAAFVERACVAEREAASVGSTTLSHVSDHATRARSLVSDCGRCTCLETGQTACCSVGVVGFGNPCRAHTKCGPAFRAARRH